MNLPPGQKAIQEFPRFGLPQYANRFPTNTKTIELSISGDVHEKFTLANELSELPRVKQVSDFHCVTTWSKTQLEWEGVRFSDFYKELVQPHTTGEITFVRLVCQDGYSTSLPLEDLLKAEVLIADSLNGAPLTIEHGAPVRLIAPAHYGYKNPKHLSKLSFYQKPQKTKSGLALVIDHPRGRVTQEERARFGPGWLYRLPYKMGIQSTIKDFRKALDKHLKELSD